MAGSTYSPIATTTLGSAAASYTFSSISGSYTDLVLVCQVQQVTDGEDLAIQVNSDTGSNYSRTYICGDGSTAHSGRSTAATSIVLDHHATPPTSSSFSVNVINFENYSNTTTNKTIIARSNSLSTYGGSVGVVGLWRSTSAITSITVFCTNSSNMKTGTTLTLYGIAAA
jgi:hypothetical protein